MRSLIVLPNLPVPIRQGLDLRSWTLIDGLLQLGPVAVFGVRPDEPAAPPLPSLESWTTSRDLHFTSKDPGADMSWLRSPTGSPGDAYISDMAAAEVGELFERFAPDVVVIEEVRLHRYLDVIDRDRCVIVVDSSTVMSSLTRRVADVASVDDRRAALLRRTMAERIERVEASVLPTVDQVWACSAIDEAELRVQHPDAALRVVPNTVDPDRYSHARSERLRVIFPAMFAYPPNESAALTLITEIMPRVREVEPAAELVLVGSHTTRRLAEAAASEGVVPRGAVADIAPELAAAYVMAVPLIVGSGTRYKLLEAFASRLPVVTSAVGAEGLDVDDGIHVLMAETPTEFALAILRLWQDAKLAAAIAEAAHERVRERYSFAASRQAVADAVRGLLPGV